MGRLIVFEGIDGVGKATQTRILAKRLRAEGRRATVFSSPRYDLPTGRLVRRALMGEFGDFLRLDPHISALAYLLDFAAWRDEMLRALEKGDVLCDRYVQSTIAYHGAKCPASKRARFLKECSSLAFDALRLPKPHRVLLLDVPVSLSQKLMREKKKDQFESSAAYQKKVALVYSRLSKDRSWKKISCAEHGEMLSREAISEKVRKALQ